MFEVEGMSYTFRGILKKNYNLNDNGDTNRAG